MVRYAPYGRSQQQKEHAEDINVSVFVSIFLLVFGFFVVLVSMRDMTQEQSSDPQKSTAPIEMAMENSVSTIRQSIATEQQKQFFLSVAQIFPSIQQNFLVYQEGGEKKVLFRLKDDDLFQGASYDVQPEMTRLINRLADYAAELSGRYDKPVISMMVGVPKEASSLDENFARQKIRAFENNLQQSPMGIKSFETGTVTGAKGSVFITLLSGEKGGR